MAMIKRQKVLYHHKMIITKIKQTWQELADLFIQHCSGKSTEISEDALTLCRLEACWSWLICQEVCTGQADLLKYLRTAGQTRIEACWFWLTLSRRLHWSGWLVLITPIILYCLSHLILSITRVRWSTAFLQLLNLFCSLDFGCLEVFPRF
jgi:hypothetical protein